MTDREFLILSYSISYWTFNLCESRWKGIFARALTRPFLLFAQESIIQILGIYMAFLYGLFYSSSVIPIHLLLFSYGFSPQSSLLSCQTYFPMSITNRQVSLAYTTSRLVLGWRQRLNLMDDSWIAYIYALKTRMVALESPNLDCVSLLYSSLFPMAGIMILISSSQRQWFLLVLSFLLDSFLQDGRHKVTCIG